MTTTPAEQWIQRRADELALSFADPEALLKRLAEIIADRYPARLGKAFWVDLEGHTDKGISLKVYERKANSLDLLVGRKSIGAAAFHRVQVGKWLPTSRVEVSIGLGAAYWTDREEWSGLATVKVTF